MTQNVFRVDADGRRVGTHVYQCTSGAPLSLGQHAVGQCQGSQEHLGNIDAGSLEAFIQVLVERLTLQDIKEDTLEMAALYAYRVELIL